MDLQTISTKQLRQELPEIKRLLLTGQSFYWIDRSKVVATIQPTVQNDKAKMSKTEYEKYIDRIAGAVKVKTNLTPAQLNKLLDKEYEEELNLE